MGGEISPAPPAVGRAVSVSEESPGSEDRQERRSGSEITQQNETTCWTVTSARDTHQGSCGEHSDIISDIPTTTVLTTSDISSTTVPTMTEEKTEAKPESGFKRNSFLRRSDSYRRAKNVLSPDLNKRKSVELVTNNMVTNNMVTNNMVTNNNNNSQTKLITAPPPAKQQEKQKGNFFRSLRSSLSFSSLRVKKCQQRPRLNISTPLEAGAGQNTTTTIRSQPTEKREASIVSSDSDSSALMTSTPVSSSSGTVRMRNSDMKARRVRSSTLNNDWEAGVSPPTQQQQYYNSNNNKLSSQQQYKPPPPEPPVRFRTAAMRKQYQRWSFAELQPSLHHCQLPSHPSQPACRSSGPEQYHYQQYPPHYHYAHPPPPPPCCQYYSFYQHSQRASIASLRSLVQAGHTQYPQHHHHQHHPHYQHHPQHPQYHPPLPPQQLQVPPQQQMLSKFENSLEGGYGFSVTKNRETRSCECPMCYHSAHNPCSVCGCPSRETKTRNESQGSTSDYSSLSPEELSHSSREGLLNTSKEDSSSPTNRPEEEEKEEKEEPSKPLNSRRHSWAGGSPPGVSIPKQTSLQDFKALLAKKTFPESAAGQEGEVGQVFGASLRKKVGPRRELAGFDAIQEEAEGSKENLLECEE